MSRLRFPSKIKGKTVDSKQTRGLSTLRPVAATKDDPYRSQYRIKGVKSLAEDTTPSNNSSILKFLIVGSAITLGIVILSRANNTNE